MSESRTTYGLYFAGVSCTWHGREPATIAGHVRCISCGGAVRSLLEEQWLAELRSADRRVPGYEAMVMWGEGRCFPDFDTLQNAYRQAMEE